MIVGLGNPGLKYMLTRHNLGAVAVEALARDQGLDLKKSRYAQALVAEYAVSGGKVILALPTTFMNNSGLAVRALADFYGVLFSNILVVSDDIRLDFGDMRLKGDGSDGGHNGHKSVGAHLGTQAYPRLRLGVGSPARPDRQADYVLSEFSKGEKPFLRAFVEEAVGCLKLWVQGETAKAMTLYNKRKANG
jgi:PTH1 family peptidyl-tRNA hydrolase